MNIYLTATNKSDAPRILEMLIELGVSDGVIDIRTTQADLEKNLYSASPVAFAKFIKVDKIVAGFVIYSWKWATFTGRKEMYMQAIYVLPEFRRKGVAQKAMSHLAAIALKEGCSRIDWYVVKGKSMSNGFYDSIGAKSVDRMVIQRLTEEPLKALADLT